MPHTRPLSLVENFNRLRNAGQLYRNFQVTATYAHPVTPQMIGAALRQVVLEHHMFVCNVFQEKDEFHFRPLERVCLEDVLEIKDEGYLEDGLISERLMREIDTIKFVHYTKKPLFRLLLVGDRTLCAVFEHTIVDGMGGVMFHEMLAEKMNNVDGVDEIFNYSKDQGSLQDLADPIDVYLEDYRKDYTFGDTDYFDKQKPNGLTQWPGTRGAAFHDPTAYKLIRFSPEEITQALRACKSEGVSFTCFLEHVLAITLHPVIGDSHYSTHRMAINMRRHIPGQESRNIIATMAHVGVAQNLPPVKELSWDLVREIQANLHTTLANKRIFNQVAPLFDGILKEPTADHKEYFHGGLGKPRVDTTKISNLGVIKSPRIKQFVFSQSLPSTASEFLLNIASTSEGTNMVLMYFDGNDFGDLAGEFKRNVLGFTSLNE